MIHESLLYLWNYPGNFFNPDAEDEWFNMVELRDFMHPGERKLLQKITLVALSYHKIQEFIKRVGALKSNQINIQAVQEVFQGNTFKALAAHQPLNKSGPSGDENLDTHDGLQEGLYLKAFCNGLDEVLDGYRDDIIQLEKAVLKDPQLPLTYVLSRVEKYTTLFDTFKSIIRVIETERLHGCVIMGRLLNYYDCGIKQVADATSRIVCTINTLFYRHLCNWIIFGDLVDVYGEFFICDAKCPDEDFLWSFSANDTKSDLESLNESSKGFKVRRPPKVRKFLLHENMVPINMTLELAQTILFMGRMVWIIRNDPTNSQDDKLKFKLKRDIWDGKETNYFHKLQALENQPLNLAHFEKAIEDCRLCLTKYLWTVMVEEADLFDHLQLLRDYYALGRGELFQQFLLTIQDKSKDTPQEYMAYKMNIVFNDTAKKLYTENDRTHKRFELYFPNNAERNVRNQWLQIEMNFEIIWPLHIIFHPGAMNLYNKLFNFLLRIKKAQYDLEMLWLNHMEGKHNIHRGIWTLRNTLLFLINNLQYYMQVDVIEAQFAVLNKSITNAQNVENIIKLHAEFLGNLMSRAFLMTINDENTVEIKNQLYKLPAVGSATRNNVHSTLLVFLELCDEFCTHASIWGLNLTQVDELELDTLQVKCDRLVEHLLTTLYSLREHASGNHLLQLLHRLDFNRWFSKNKPDLNLSSLM